MPTTPLDLTRVETGAFTPTDAHARLARLAGRWSGTARTFFDPSNPDAAEVAPWAGTIETILGGRFARFTYASRAMGQPIAGELTIAYESGDRKFRTAWIDSLHTSPAILVSESETTDGSEAIVVRGSYFAAPDQPRWGWRTEIDDAPDGALRIRMFNIEPDGAEALGVDIELTR